MKIPHIKNAFENIQTACNYKFSKLYPVNPPTDILNRYNQELDFLKHSEAIDDFELFRLLSEEAHKCSTVITMRGTLTGSFLHYLLGVNSFNPLPVHYYCSQCGHYEQPSTRLFGIDLPIKPCPNCGKSILADGYNLPQESVWGIDGKKLLTFDYNICSEFLPFARRVLTSLYSDNHIVPWGMFQFESENIPPRPDARAIGVDLVGYVILPTGNTINDYPELISYLENGDPCIVGSSWELENHFLKPIRLYSSEYIDKIIKLQRSTGIYANDINSAELREVTWSNILNATVLNSTTSNFFHALKPKTYKEMIAIESVSHSTFTWQELDFKNIDDYNHMISSNSFQKYPCFTREDFFDYLIEEGYDRTFAFDVSEHIRKGHATSPKYSKDFHSLSIPEDLKEVASNYSYIFPRSHCIEYILFYAKIAYYAKIDSRAFSEIMFKKN